MLLVGFFNAKLCKHQVTWLPCEIEALCIGAAIRHLTLFIDQSCHSAQLLTDSCPCVQADSKLMHGKFSASSKVTSFLSTASHYHVQVRHVNGIAVLTSHFGSHNLQVCLNTSCEVCKFIKEMEIFVVHGVSVGEVQGASKRLIDL